LHIFLLRRDLTGFLPGGWQASRKYAFLLVFSIPFGAKCKSAPFRGIRADTLLRNLQNIIISETCISEKKVSFLQTVVKER